ncbi:MAG: helix-turn-helix domain-containing protein [Atopobiaceae bacterium]|jgi:transcriptional regulator with XRE-family HTH domain|nr:helix-turn-helix domain-containing protein [Atopobiaceae bacterium]MCI2172733.1 helix-turn-helix domain-containing protein [Atopobiaceae bacterium]MCI2207040.1 helix-turn-helix domain-containing protein [Atopobiaceae bacterium]
MSFRDNLQHLRATRNMTQEQLAMLLGVSRQSVSKWEAERSYPEMDKLLKICDLFDCTLDDLVSGDLTGRPDETSSAIPSGPATDVTGYDEAMRRFAWKMALGVAIILLGAALACLLSGVCTIPGADPDTYSVMGVLGGVAVGLAFIIPSSLERTSFEKAHPYVEDFYTTEDKDAARRSLSHDLVGGIAIVMVAVMSGVLLSSNDNLCGFAIMAILAPGVFLLVRGPLLSSRTDVERYNDDALGELSDREVDQLGDPSLQERARTSRRENGIYGSIMGVATIVGLLLLFVPAFHAQPWFWVAWPIGGLACGLVRSLRWRQA